MKINKILHQYHEACNYKNNKKTMTNIQLQPINEIFLPENIQKSVNKAIAILNEIEGETTEEKLVNIGHKFNHLKIKGIDDKESYELVHRALLDMQKVRVAIKKIGKQWRDNLTAANRQELAKEKELLSLFSETEERLKAEKQMIDELRIKEERKKLLPFRRETLKSIEIEIDDDELLSMSEDEFAKFFAEQKDIYDQEKEEERLRIEREKELEKERAINLIKQSFNNESLEKNIKKIKKELRIELDNVINKQKQWIKQQEEERIKKEEELKKQAEIEKQKAVEEAKRQAELEKQRLIEEQKRKEEEAKKQEEERKRKELEEKERQEKNAKFIQWKKENKFNEETDIVKRNGDTFILYRKVSEITIK